MSQIRPLVTWTSCVPTKVKKPDRKALREGPAPFSTMPAKFRSLDEQKGGAEHECEGREEVEAPRLPPFRGQRPEPACVAREQQALVSMKTLRRLNSSPACYGPTPGRREAIV